MNYTFEEKKLIKSIIGRNRPNGYNFYIHLNKNRIMEENPPPQDSEEYKDNKKNIQLGRVG